MMKVRNPFIARLWWGSSLEGFGCPFKGA